VTVCNSVIILSWFLLGCWSCLAFFADSLLKTCLCPCMDCWCPSHFLLFQFMNTLLETLVDVPSQGWSPVSGCEEHNLANCSSISLPSIPMCIAHTTNIYIMLYVLPVSPGIDDSPRLIWNLSGSSQRPWWLPDCQRESSSLALFCIPHYTSISGIYFSLEYCGVEPKTEAVSASWVPSLHPSINSHLSGNVTMNGCSLHISVASYLTPPIGWVHTSYPKNFGVTEVKGFGFHYWVHIP
jgi:hypothetical protein